MIVTTDCHPIEMPPKKTKKLCHTPAIQQLSPYHKTVGPSVHDIYSLGYTLQCIFNLAYPAWEVPRAYSSALLVWRFTAQGSKIYASSYRYI